LGSDFALCRSDQWIVVLDGIEHSSLLILSDVKNSSASNIDNLSPCVMCCGGQALSASAFVGIDV
jgi:hypothetical protein